ncbi:trimethyllysine dioxygenase [Malassezia sp. CBS 17886]|nr:trimethyllysine dioxygenase [Malassezia sp. CBS 17886]
MAATRHYLWLRDHCRCAECYHPQTKQRLLDTFQIPAAIRAHRSSSTADGLLVEWPETNGARHTSLFPWQWLMRNAWASPTRARRNTLHFRSSGTGQSSAPYTKKLWDSGAVAGDPPLVAYEDVMRSDRGLSEWLDRIDEYGLCFVSGIPISPEATEELVRRIAFIRETHYGGFWDFTSDLAHGDTAYTDVALGAHTDTTYFTDPAGLQMFHLLHHHSIEPTDFRDRYTGAPLGGASLFVDGFWAAQRMHETHPDLYQVLRETRFRGHSAGDDDTLVAPLLDSGYSIFEHDPHTDDLVMVRYNNSDRSVLRVDQAGVERVYEALRRWNEIITSPDAEYWFQMEPGTGMIFDNHRVLHGRSQFVGSRRLCGAYVNHDDYRSRLSVLRARMHDSGRGTRPRGVWDDGL